MILELKQIKRIKFVTCQQWVNFVSTQFSSHSPTKQSYNNYSDIINTVLVQRLLFKRDLTEHFPTDLATIIVFYHFIYNDEPTSVKYPTDIAAF